MKGNGCLSELEYADNAITGASVAVLERGLAQGPMYLERYVQRKPSPESNKNSSTHSSLACCYTCGNGVTLRSVY